MDDVFGRSKVGAGPRAVPDQHQRVDGLVNNVGASLHGPLAEVDPAECRKILDLNVVSLLEMTQAVLPAMREQGFGRIVNISSGASITPPASSSAIRPSLRSSASQSPSSRRPGPAATPAASASPSGCGPSSSWPAETADADRTGMTKCAGNEAPADVKD
jgi:NAD(P)-dependent dehydrogenase (short-subunit alcohol dehydrogenase family)